MLVAIALAAMLHTAISPLPPRLTVLDDSIFNPVIAQADEFGYPALTVDKRKVLGQVRAESWGTLEPELRRLQREVRSDIRNEYRLRDSYYALYNGDPTLTPHLAAWREASPESPEAHAAGAVHSLGLGSESRGAGWASRLTPEQVRGLRVGLTGALESAERSIRLEPDNLVAHLVAIAAAIHFGWSDEARARIDRALAELPASYVLRFQALQNMEPRWGGSIGLMEAFLAETEPVERLNPRLAALQGRVLAYRASRWRLRGLEGRAVKLYTRAMESGRDWHFYLERGRSYVDAGHFVRGLHDLRQAARQRPQHLDALRLMGISEVALGLATPPPTRFAALDRGIENLQLALDLAPRDDALRRALEAARLARRMCMQSPDCM